MNEKAIEQKVKSLRKEYGRKAHKVAQEVLNNIHIKDHLKRGIWIEINKQLKPKPKKVTNKNK